MIPGSKRGFAYGLFNTAYGLAWFAGSLLMGILYQSGRPYIIWFVVAMEVLSMLSFLRLCKKIS